FFFQAEDGIRDFHVTGVQTCALPISDYQWSDMDDRVQAGFIVGESDINSFASVRARLGLAIDRAMPYVTAGYGWADVDARILGQIGRAACRERAAVAVGARAVQPKAR